MTMSMDDLPMIGQVNKNLFWSIMLVALLAMTGMVALASRGAVAMAAAIPTPFTVQSTTITVASQNGEPPFALYPGISPADGQSPVAVSRLDNASIVNMVITKSFSFAGHTLTVKLAAGGNGTPVSINGLVMDANSLNVGSATFSHLTLSAGGIGGLEQDASSATLSNSSISSPYLLANSITLPSLAVTLSIS